MLPPNSGGTFLYYKNTNLPPLLIENPTRPEEPEQAG
jgi:hypothetical protein